MASSGEKEAGKAAVQQTGADPALIAAGASVLFAWYNFYLRGNRETGLFVGLWPPTILAFASYFKQTQISDKLEYAVGSDDESLRQSVSRMIQGQE